MNEKENTKTRKKAVRKEKKQQKVSLSTIILVVILIVGMGVLLYPTVSDYWNSFHQTRAIASYDTIVAEMEKTDYDSIFAAAGTYNEHLRGLSGPFSGYDELDGEYYRTLDVTGTGIMGYVSIKKLGVELPIYHGTSDAVLNIACGHVEGSSLPVGGESTHSVLSAHRGLPSAKLFTDLDDLIEGDTFTVTILNRLLTYEVDQILIVEPTHLEPLNVIYGEDYCTLLTCTPYGINTHRLLVRGKRTENAQGEIVVHADAFKIPPFIVLPAIAIPLLFIFLIVLLIIYSRKPKKVTTADIRELSKTLNSLNKEE